jgi:DNA-binding NarL/FixJ family response regulator
MRFLIADDHGLFRQGCRLLLEELSPGAEIIEAGDFDQVEKAIKGQPEFDLILLDLKMPGLDEIEGIKRVRQLAPSAPLVIVSALDDPYYAQRAMDCGAAGYIPKSSNHTVIQSALQMILAGGHYVPPAMLSQPRGKPERPSRSGPSDNLNSVARDALTPRQLDVMRYLAQGKSNKGIAVALGLSEGTVKVHVAAILKTLKADNRTQAVLLASNMLGME